MANKFSASKFLSTSMSSGALLAFTMGCASQQPAPQFVDAQRTYEAAAQGKAGEFAPDDLLAAKKLLDQAEAERNGSPQQIQYSYLADRQARLATSNGTIEFYQKEATQAQNNYISGLEHRSSTAEKELEETRSELSSIEEELQKKDANVDELSARKAELERRKAELESKLTVKEAALGESEAARAAAEQREKAALASLNKLAMVKEEANETVITLSGSVLFKTGEAELLPIAETNLTTVAEAIKTMDDEKKIVVEGHTDSNGADAMNKELSQKRAQSVMKYLASQGVAPDRMSAVGKGESDPVAENSSPEGRANNRRVELHISGGSKASSKSADANSKKAADTSS